MPAQITFYSNKTSEVLVSETSSGAIGTSTTSVVSLDILSAPEDSAIIGSGLVTKTATVDQNGNVFAKFDWQFKFNEDNSLTIPDDLLAVCFCFFNQTTSGVNPTEIVPAGSNSVTLTGGVLGPCSNGEFCNQFGYCNKTKYNSSTYRQYDVYFPQLVASYTNAFNSLPQTNVAPL